MAHTRRVQILMEPDEYEQLVRIAERRAVSVAELIRSAVRSVYLRSTDERTAAVDRIASMDLPTAPWPDLKREIEEACDAGLP